ncbi:HEPN domain-containing protein [Leisingera methylohalidivorans]|uniref:HEPN domain-containing protein n=1 Tax=Leisingera methylohalidivorans DSM 14336 TaxID=999552 RepID=V9VYU6_9RHOB|nr:HEPN domain-containing protein [Leisingera methylohalidivorans]AHD02919.1 hypothetical protein METH_06285 [Leisingera methylohalidivorans DSM 14336]
MRDSADRDEINFANYVHGVFLRPADEDYLIARMSAKNGFWNHFCWSAQQSLEKYLKCYLALRHVSIRFGNRNTHDLEKLLQRTLSQTNEFDDRAICAPSGFPSELVKQADFGEKISSFVSRVNNYGQPRQRYREVGYLIEPGDVHKLDDLARSLRKLCFECRDFEISSGRQVLQQGKWVIIKDSIPKEPKTFRVNGDYRSELTYGNYAFFPDLARSERQTIMAHCYQLGSLTRIEKRLNISDANIVTLRNLGVID